MTQDVSGALQREILIRGVSRIGVRTVERDDAHYFLTIRNRSYASEHEVTVDVARRHYRHIRRP